jgi:hypothetical protein
VRGSKRQVGDAAQVEHRHVLARRGEASRVEGRHQRRALAAGGDVAAAQSQTTSMRLRSASNAPLSSCSV